MAFVDGELEPAAHAAFAARLATKPTLAREVAELRGLAIAAREMAPPEPADHEWQRLRGEDAHRLGLGLGISALFVGGLVLVGWAVLWVRQSEALPGPVRWALYLIIFGGTVLFLTVLRARLRTLPLDPYTHVRR